MAKMRMAIRATAIAWVALYFVSGMATRVAAQEAKVGEAEQAGPYGLLVIRDVTVIDGSGAPAFGPADVFVKGNRIVRVVPSDAISRERSEGGVGARTEADGAGSRDRRKRNVRDAGLDRCARTHQ